MRGSGFHRDYRIRQNGEIGPATYFVNRVGGVGLAGVKVRGSRRGKVAAGGETTDEKLIEFFSNEKQVTKDTPPTYIFHTADDKAVPVENAKKFYEALKKAGVPVELNIHEKGPHGVGLARDPKWTKGADGGLGKWPDQLAAWLKTQGLLEKK